MRKSTKRPPDRGGDREVVAKPQRELGLAGGGSIKTGFPRAFRRHGEYTLRCSFTVGGTRYAGPTPYAEFDMATAFAKGALAVAEAVHADGGRTALVRAMGGRTGTMRWQAKAARRGFGDPPISPLPYAHVGREHVAAWIAACARRGEAKDPPPRDHDGD